MTYAKFRTGLQFSDVYYMIYNRQHKRRRGVLGYWHELKLKMWAEHKANCGQQVENEFLQIEGGY